MRLEDPKSLTDRHFKSVGKAFRKKDAMALVTGQPVYTDDIAPENCLLIGLLRSPHANAIVKKIDTTAASKVPGIEVIYTWEDVDQEASRYTNAGQTYPEPSPTRKSAQSWPPSFLRARMFSSGSVLFPEASGRVSPSAS